MFEGLLMFIIMVYPIQMHDFLIGTVKHKFFIAQNPFFKDEGVVYDDYFLRNQE